ncbi:hypothetical protein [Bradyrhizobium sp. JYMT SZCCT0180]|uniref:hypothetical protein n=1 Tax=Bradyrhizobium sp. JYMT SZCCT0180 TaxID=2807666 RepID=UPI001BABFC7F|nr:hypothetical protein [Bradyrhizobium sp. JYMT SZCCT0180]MBR1211331.1 hypothetical protein [Bradyrhizobium sp. JYMT SZCCT0180]
MRKGERRVGRAKGTPNKFTRDVKEAIINAAALSKHSKTDDLEGYMVYLADNKQEVFATLLGKLIPVQAKIHATGPSAVNLNLSLKMPLADMVSTFEQRIKGSYMPAPQRALPITIGHDEDKNA